MMSLQLFIFVILWLCCDCYYHGYGQSLWPKMLQFLGEQNDLKQFTQLIRDNEGARRLLTYHELTVLAPTDNAFDEFRGRYDPQIVLYHMLPVAMNMELLEERATEGKYVEAIREEFPHLWPWKSPPKLVNDEDEFAERMFINEAMFVDNQTDFEIRTRDDVYGKLQIIHKINKVLSPMASTTVAPSAYHFLSQTNLWHLVPYAFNNFNKRIITTNSVGLYKELSEDYLNHNQGHTFLIPADEFRSSVDDTEITRKLIECSILKRVVFVTRGNIDSNYETLNPNCHVTIITPNLLNIRDTLYSNSKSIQILIGNIPLKNGVLHVVKQMPGLFRPKLLPVFPFRTLWEHVNNDWRLQLSTKLLELANSGVVQEIINESMQNYTMFLLYDDKWEHFVSQNGKTMAALEEHKHLNTLMLRHVSPGIYDMNRLVEISRTNLRGETLLLGSGNDKVIVKFNEDDEGNIQVVWGTKIMNIIRSNVLCSNGIIHIIDAPFIFDEEVRDEAFSLVKLWAMISKFVY